LIEEVADAGTGKLQIAKSKLPGASILDIPQAGNQRAREVSYLVIVWPDVLRSQAQLLGFSGGLLVMVPAAALLITADCDGS
jgi:hypothetical protein